MPFRVILGVSGSIAAFKAAALASSLIQSEYEVQVVLTDGGARFVPALTFEAITGRAVASDVWDEDIAGSRMGHLALARWGDVLVVAPASAGAIARLALGIPADMLGAVALAAPSPLLIAPAMETGMWRHPATQEHVETLRRRGAVIVGPLSGRLASGASGEGRMAEPQAIVVEIERTLKTRHDLSGVRVLVTAGPTYEAVDPVRFVGNRSSGKMGYAVAEEARDRGAEVTLISGPVSLPAPPEVTLVPVESHAQMRDAVLTAIRDQDVVVMAAAVSDFAPAAPATEKIKRGDSSLALELAATSDIAAEAARANRHALHIGFALETGELVERAREKLGRKGQGMVVANAVTPDHNPFGSDTNRVALVTPDGVEELRETSKREVARHIWDAALALRPDLRKQDSADE